MVRYTYIQVHETSGRMVSHRIPAPIYAVAVQSCEASGDDQEVLAQAWTRNNRDDRPLGQTIRSMSVGDVVVVERPGKLACYVCAKIGWRRLGGRAAEQAYSLHRRGVPGHTIMDQDSYFQSLRED